MRVSALYCPGCGAPVTETGGGRSHCEYCSSYLVIQPGLVRQEKGQTQKSEASPVSSPLPSQLISLRTARFELSLLEQLVPTSGPEWFRPLELTGERFALIYLRLVDEKGNPLEKDPEPTFSVMEASLLRDGDPGLSAYLALEHLVGEGFREHVEVCVLLFEPDSSSVLTYNAGCPGCLLWASLEEGRTIDTGRSYPTLQPKMLREQRDYFSNSTRIRMTADDILVLCSASFAGRGEGPYSGALSALHKSLNQHLGEHPLRVVTLAKNAFWTDRAPAVKDEMPESHLRVAAVRVLPVLPDQELPPGSSLDTHQVAHYDLALWRRPEDYVELFPLHGERWVLIWLSDLRGEIPEERVRFVTSNVLAVLDRPNHGDNENPRRAGKEALEGQPEELRLCLIQFFPVHSRIKYYRRGWKQPLALGARGLKETDSLQQFDEGGEATVGPGRRLFFPGAQNFRGQVSTGQALAELWPGGKASALYQSLFAHWRTKNTGQALQELLLATTGDGGIPDGLALLSNVESG